MSAAALPPQPWVCLVTDLSLCESGVIGLERAVMGALDSGVNLIQLRERSLASRELFELGQRLRRLTTEAGAALLVNDRFDVALAIRADGVHLGERGLPASVVRSLAGDAVVGCSAHGRARALEAQAAGADYLMLGTIFSTASHPGVAPSGPQLIRKVRAHVKLPIIAIGGITPDNAAQTIAVGAAGVAVIRSILSDPHPGQAARRLVECVREAWPTAALHRKL